MADSLMAAPCKAPSLPRLEDRKALCQHADKPQARPLPEWICVGSPTTAWQSCPPTAVRAGFEKQKVILILNTQTIKLHWDVLAELISLVGTEGADSQSLEER